MFADPSSPGSDCFEQAKQRSLNEFIQHELGTTGKAHGLYVRYPSCLNPDCRASENRHSVRLAVRDDSHFHCFRCGAHGSIIDAAMLLWGLERPLDAARALLGMVGMPARRASVVTTEFLARRTEEEDTLRRALAGIRAAADEAADDAICLRYLTCERCIPMDVIRQAQERRLLGFLPSSRNKSTQLLRQRVGDDLLRGSGLWNPTCPAPWIAMRPLVFFFPVLTAAEFRLNRAPRPEEKKALRRGRSAYPWFWRGQDGVRALVVEGFIDLLSAVAMGYPGHIIGIPGCNNWGPEWFVRLRDGGVRLIEIGFDDDLDSKDNPGQRWAGILGDYLEEIEVPHRIARPAAADMNELLRLRVAGTR